MNFGGSVLVSVKVQYRYFEKFDQWGRYLGDFSYKHTALAAGLGALSRNESQEFTMDSQTYSYGQLNHFHCRWCLDGFTEGSGSRTHIEPPEKFQQVDFAKAAAKRAIPDKGLYLMGFIDFCGKCMHQCPSPDFNYTPKPIIRYQNRTGCYTKVP
ncbi:MAG: hypothetical protein QF876_06690 [Desulfobacterales bacterium]|nr:hypothetical protein [Desulfobacterales bacterium]|tara:strand:- start:17968 stop:18432 length:465 start_codon:yes stop_codon:yes gene_type:complete